MNDNQLQPVNVTQFIATEQNADGTFTAVAMLQGFEKEKDAVAYAHIMADGVALHLKKIGGTLEETKH